jgi:hypothetical protein
MSSAIYSDEHDLQEEILKVFTLKGSLVLRCHTAPGILGGRKMVTSQIHRAKDSGQQQSFTRPTVMLFASMTRIVGSRERTTDHIRALLVVHRG